jgi:hypothetical protein
MTVRIDQLTEPPRVGRSYLVPCLVPRSRDTQIIKESLSDFHSEAYRDWVMGVRPVLLPLHEDSELGVAQQHYHTDVRFCSELRLRDFRDSSKSFTSHEIKLHEMVNSHEEFLEKGDLAVRGDRPFSLVCLSLESVAVLNALCGLSVFEKLDCPRRFVLPVAVPLNVGCQVW